MASVWITTRTTQAGSKRYRVEYRLGGAGSRTRYGGTFKTRREANLRKHWIAGEIAALRAPDLTILNVIWAPKMMVMPHNHQMWAVIGIYTGREDNVFWRRLPDNSSRVEAAGARSLCVGDAEPLGHNIIHSVANPIPRLTGAIHVYGGDFFAPGRSEWDPETLREGPYDAERTMRMFEEANEASRRFAS